MKKLFKWVLILTAALAVGVIVLIYNPGLIKAPLERYLTNVSGYTINLDGDLDIKPGELTSLTATRVRVTAPVWSTHRDLVNVGKLHLVLDSSSLFQDIMVIESLLMDKVQVNLETDSNGFGNWIVSTAQPPEELSDSDPVVVFNNIQVHNTGLRFLNGRKEIEQLFQIATLHQEKQVDGMLNLSLEGDFNDRPVAFEGSIGPYENLLQGHEVVFSGSGNFGSLDISGNGLIHDLLKPARPQFNLKIQGPNIDEVTAMFGVDDLGSGVFSFLARGEEVNDRYEASINGEIGDLSLSISAESSDISKLDEVDLALAANGPRLGAVMRAVGVDDWPDKPFSIQADIERVGSTLNVPRLTLGIGGSRLEMDAMLSNFPHLDSSRVRLSVDGDDIAQFRDLLGIPGITTGPFEIRGKLDVNAEEVELLQVNLKTSLGNLMISGSLGPGPTYVGSTLHLHLDGASAHNLMSAFNIDALPEDAFNLDARIETTENGLILERGVLVTNKGERLELSGFLSFEPGSKGTAVDVKLDGNHLAQVLGRFSPDFEIPDVPYDLSGHLDMLEDGIQLENVKAGFADIDLELAGLIAIDDGLLGTSLDFNLNGENLSTLQNIPILSHSLDVFVPGQPYQAIGHFKIESDGLKLDGINGRIGETSIGLDGLISTKPGQAGSNLNFSIKGSDLHGFLADRPRLDLPPGIFESSGQMLLTGDKLSINRFRYDAEKAHAKLDLGIGWPVSSTVDVDFDVDLSGENIRNLLPQTDFFKPERAAFKIQANGHKHGDRISLKHFHAEIGDLLVSLKGALDEDITNESVDIAFEATSVDFSTFGTFNGNRLPAMALDLKAKIKGNARQFSILDLTGKLGKTDLAGKVDVSLVGPKPKIDLVAKSTYFDLRPFLKPIEDADEGVAETKKERLIPATPLPLTALNAADITILLNADEIMHRNDYFNNLVLEAETLAGSLKIPKISLDGRRGKFTSSLSVIPTTANSADVKIDLNAEKLIANLTKLPEDKLAELPAFDIDFHASGKGSNLQELAASLNGRLTTTSEGGTVEGVSLGILDTFVLDEIFSLIMPKSDMDEALVVTCHASAFQITDGLVKTDPAITYSTSKLILVSKGTLDLKTEKLHLNFNATPKNILKISPGELFNPYILIGGTLADPDIGLDPAKAILHGGAAVGTAGISILAKGLIDRASTAKPLCNEMSEQISQERQ